MILTINNARLIRPLTLREGDYNGEHWSIQEFLFHVDENFSNVTKLVISAKNERIAQLATIPENTVIPSLKVIPSSRQNSKSGYWNTDLALYAAVFEENAQRTAPAPARAAAPAPATPKQAAPIPEQFRKEAAPAAAPEPLFEGNPEDDLPF